MSATEASVVVPTASRRRRFAVLRSLLARIETRWLVAMAVLVVLITVAGAAQSLALKWIVNGSIDQRWTFTILAAVIGALAAGVLGSAGRVYANLQDLSAATVGVAIDKETVEAAATMPGLEHLERPEYLDQLELVRDGSNDLVRSVFGVTDVLSLGARIAVSLWLLALVDPLLILVVLFAIPSVLLSPLAQRRIEEANVFAAERVRASDHLHQLFTDQTAGMEMRIFGCGAQLDARADQLWKDVAQVKLRAATKAAGISSLGWAALAIGFVAALAVVVDKASHGAASPGDILLVAQLTLLLRSDVSQTSVSIRQSVAAMRLIDRYIWLDELAAEQKARFQGSVPCPQRIERGISIQHVSFSYPGTRTAVLRDITFDIPAGATVAVVGENGAGKSTLVKLLCRYYDPSNGHILVDGVPLADLDPAEWRTRLAGSFQDYLRIETTGQYTVGLGDPPWMTDDERVRAAFQRADAQQLPEKWPNGLTTQLGKSHAPGIELSGGQWQRLAIARAMMRPTPLLLVLDEPTAALDPAAEQALYERYMGAARRAHASGGSVLLVSHRFTSVKMADLIVVIDAGVVVERGTHDELARDGGPYAQMFQRQASAYS